MKNFKWAFILMTICSAIGCEKRKLELIHIVSPEIKGYLIEVYDANGPKLLKCGNRTVIFHNSNIVKYSSTFSNRLNDVNEIYIVGSSQECSSIDLDEELEFDVSLPVSGISSCGKGFFAVNMLDSEMNFDSLPLSERVELIDREICQ